MHLIDVFIVHAPEVRPRAIPSPKQKTVHIRIHKRYKSEKRHAARYTLIMEVEVCC